MNPSFRELNSIRISINTSLLARSGAEPLTPKILETLDRPLLEQFFWALLCGVNNFVESYTKRNPSKSNVESRKSSFAAREPRLQSRLNSDVQPLEEAWRSVLSAETSPDESLKDARVPAGHPLLEPHLGSMDAAPRTVRFELMKDSLGEEFVNDYLVLSEIGRGACARVVVAINQKRPGQLVAIKIVRHSLTRDSKARSHPFRKSEEESSWALDQLLLLSQANFGSCSGSPAGQSVQAASVSNAGSSSPRASPRLTHAASPTTQSEDPGSGLNSRKSSFGGLLFPPPRLARRQSIVALKRELAVMKKLRHPNVVSLHAIIDDPEGNLMYIVMDYVPNGPVVKVREASPPTCDPVSDLKARKYMKQLVDGLQYLHSQNIVHRDIKPANILLGEDDHIYLSDFGVAEITKNEMSVQSTRGTLLHLPPEMFSAETNEWSGVQQDLWALGVTLYVMLTGKYPFYGETYFSICKSVCDDQLELPPSLSAHAKDLLTGMLTKSPAQRLTMEQIKVHPFLDFSEESSNQPPHITDTDLMHAIETTTKSTFGRKMTITDPLFVDGTIVPAESENPSPVVEHSISSLKAAFPGLPDDPPDAGTGKRLSDTRSELPLPRLHTQRELGLSSKSFSDETKEEEIEEQPLTKTPTSANNAGLPHSLSALKAQPVVPPAVMVPERPTHRLALAKPLRKTGSYILPKVVRRVNGAQQTLCPLLGNKLA